MTRPINNNGIKIGDVGGNSFAQYISMPFETSPYILLIGGNVGIGTGTPMNRTDVFGAMAIGTSYAGFFAAPSNGLIVQGNVGIGTTSPSFKLGVNGNIGIPAANTYRYNTAKTKKYKVGPSELQSANPTVYHGRMDDGFSSANINGMNSLWAESGSAGTVAYFTAAVHLPDSAVITGLSAQLVKNGGSLQSVVELWRSDASGYLTNTAQLIATCSTISSSGGVVTVNAPSVNAAYNVVDNTNYIYFIRYSGEQNTQNLRYNGSTITYQIYRSDY